MATTVTEKPLLIGGEWVETGEWLEVRSPYSGEVVGRVAKAGAEETRRAIDAAERTMQEPLPAHKRAEILVRVARMLAPALAAGCAVVLKPAGQTPLSALLLAELETEAGLPPGWLNVLVGPSSDIGDVLVGEDRVKALSFTGSSEVGWRLRERAPRKRVLLELGNSTPAIVQGDADLDVAAEKLAVNSFSFAGQSCISTQRIYLQKWIADDFMERFIPKVEALVVGDPTEEATDVGPVVDDGARDRILTWIDEATNEGATILTGGSVLEGRLIRPTVLGNVNLGMKVCREEVFGPVVTIDSYESLDDAILLANGTRYGLQAGIFTDSLPSAMRAAQLLRFGGVTVNEAPTFRADQMPYGGVKDSGNTREGPAYAVREMTEERLVVLQL